MGIVMRGHAGSGNGLCRWSLEIYIGGILWDFWYVLAAGFRWLDVKLQRSTWRSQSKRCYTSVEKYIPIHFMSGIDHLTHHSAGTQRTMDSSWGNMNILSKNLEYLLAWIKRTRHTSPSQWGTLHYPLRIRSRGNQITYNNVVRTQGHLQLLQ